MSAREQYTVGPAADSDGWELVRDGLRIGMFDTQTDGIATARRVIRYRRSEMKKLAELTIKRPNGVIRDKRTYGKDPRDTKG